MSESDSPLTPREQTYSQWRAGHVVSTETKDAWFAGYDTGSGAAAALALAVSRFIATGTEQSYGALVAASAHFAELTS